jgi:hypothetical protein
MLTPFTLAIGGLMPFIAMYQELSEHLRLSSTKLSTPLLNCLPQP